MKLFKSKKASSILMMVFELMAVVLIVSMLMLVSKKLNDSESVHKNLIAEDLNMMINYMASVSGDIILKYPLQNSSKNISAYEIVLTSSNVDGTGTNDAELKVSIGGEVSLLDSKRTLFLPTGYTAIGIAEQKERICLTKQGKSITLEGC
ncbi:hypothetical protein HN918_03875 [archaeon]|nr:hypothetical protein [archaeon]